MVGRRCQAAPIVNPGLHADATPTTRLCSLTCARCSSSFEPDAMRGSCSCGGPLLADYEGIPPELVLGDLWSYSWLLPVADVARRVSLGEGGTPVIEAPRLAEALGIHSLYIKNEGQQPSGTFKARGASVSVSKAAESGHRELALATAGNSGIAWAIYATRAGLTCHVFLPTWTARETTDLLRALNADVRLIEGPVSVAGRACADEAAANGWWSVGAWAEPYRVEGDKTLGLELLADPRTSSADAVIWPCASGIGLVGTWKAGRDLNRLGMEARVPSLFGAQSETCAPLHEAWRAGAPDLLGDGQPWTDVGSIARGLLAPAPSAAALILRAVRDTGGGFVTATDQEIVSAARLTVRLTGLLLAPEAAAAVAGIPALLREGLLSARSNVVVVATGAARPSDYYAWSTALATPDALTPLTIDS